MNNAYSVIKCRQQQSEVQNCDDVRNYAVLLKDFVLYMRHGIMTHSIRQLDLALPEAIPR